MTPIKTPQIWLVPMVGICALTATLSGACGIALYVNIVPIPSVWLGLGLSALSVLSSALMLLWIKQAIAAPLKRHDARLSQALSRGLLGDAFQARDETLSGLGSVLDHHTCAMRAALIDVCEADLSDGRQAVHLRFNGDAAARLEQLAASVEASDAWLRQRQDTLIGLHTTVAEQAAAATQTLKDLSDKERLQQMQMDTFLAGAPEALAHMQAQISLWNEIDPRSFASIQAQLDDGASNLERMLQSLEQGCKSVGDTSQILSVAADRSQTAVTDLNSAAGNALAQVEASTSALAQAGDEVGGAARKLSLLAKGGKTGLLRGLKGLSQSQEELQIAVQDLMKGAETFTAHGADVMETSKAEVSEMRAAIHGFSGAANVAAEKLHGEIEAAIAGNQTTLMEAAAAVKQEARAVVEAGMSDILEASKTHASALSKEMTAINEQGALLKDARTAAHAVNTMLIQLQDQASQSQNALKAMLTAQEAAMVPLEQVSQRASAPIEALLKVDSGHVGKVIADIETAAQKLSALEDMQAAPKLEILQGQLLSMQTALAEGLEAHFQTHSQSIAATHTAIDILAQRLPETDADSALHTQLMAIEKTVLQRIENIQSNIAETHTQALQAAGKTTASTVRTQLRQLSEQLKGQNDALRTTLKDLRTTQLQPLKRSMRTLPEHVAEQLSPALTSAVQSMQEAFESTARTLAPPRKPEGQQEPGIDDAATSLSERLEQALSAMDAIETDLTSLATAALAAPQAAGNSEALNQTMKEAEAVLSAWGGKLDNISTAIAIAQDAA